MAAHFLLAPEPLANGVWVFAREVFGRSGGKGRVEAIAGAYRPRNRQPSGKTIEDNQKVAHGMPVTMKRRIHFQVGERKRLQAGEQPEPAPKGAPRVAKLMALAIRFDRLLRDGVVKNQAELAQLGRVTPARVSQILNLLQLALEIQESLLFLPRVESERGPIHEKLLRPIAAEIDWGKQREMWAGLEARRTGLA